MHKIDDMSTEELEAELKKLIEDENIECQFDPEHIRAAESPEYPRVPNPPDELISATISKIPTFDRTEIEIVEMTL